MQIYSGEKVNVFEGDYIGHCEENKVHMNMCLILNGYGDGADWIHKYKSNKFNLTFLMSTIVDVPHR